MRKGIKNIASLLCGVSLMGWCSPAGAETLIEYDLADSEVKISGRIADSVSDYATVSIFLSDVDPDDITESSSELDNALYKVVKLSADGSFDDTIILPDSFAKGEYALRTYGSDLEGINYFVRTADTVTKSDLSDINNAQDASQVLAALKALDKIPFGDTELTSYGKKISQYVYSSKPSAGYDADSLISAYYSGLALARMQSGDITPDEALTQYSAYVPVDYNEDYSTLTEGEKQTLQELFASAKSASGAFDEIYNDLATTAKMINASSFEKLREIYLAYAKENDISLKDYNSLDKDYNRDKVFMAMYEVVGKANNMADIDEMFKEAVEDEKDNSSSSGGGGSSSGGGGSSGSAGGSATYVPVDTAKPAGVFADTYGHWAEDEILALKDMGVINGFEDRSFRPDNTVSRAEFVKMICAMLDIPPMAGSHFEDVKPEEWFAGYVYGAHGRGIVNGTSDTAFSPYSPVTRQDAAVIIDRALNLASGGEIAFADSGAIADYAKESVANLASAGILGGYEDNTIRPGAFLTRAETAAILCRVISLK